LNIQNIFAFGSFTFKFLKIIICPKDAEKYIRINFIKMEVTLMEVGFWSIVPPLLTIVLAIATKEVLLSLFIGVYTGCLIIVGGNPLAGFEKMMDISYPNSPIPGTCRY
jgi:hypothetical protein